jgi:hypothetical protein
MEGTQISVREFADKVLWMVRMSPRRFRYGDDKIFIYSAWALSHQTPRFPKMRLRMFKELLERACKEGLVYLGKADSNHLVPRDIMRKSKLQWELDGIRMVSNFIHIT